MAGTAVDAVEVDLGEEEVASEEGEAEVALAEAVVAALAVEAEVVLAGALPAAGVIPAAVAVSVEPRVEVVEAAAEVGRHLS